jgi:hypothetical protein
MLHAAGRWKALRLIASNFHCLSGDVISFCFAPPPPRCVTGVKKKDPQNRIFSHELMRQSRGRIANAPQTGPKSA